MTLSKVIIFIFHDFKKGTGTFHHKKTLYIITKHWNCWSERNKNFGWYLTLRKNFGSYIANKFNSLTLTQTIMTLHGACFYALSCRTIIMTLPGQRNWQWLTMNRNSITSGVTTIQWWWAKSRGPEVLRAPMLLGSQEFTHFSPVNPQN